jgi:hypothetical protein
VTLFVRDLVDENGAPLSLYREGVTLSAAAAVGVVSSLAASVAVARPFAVSLATTSTITPALSVASPTDISSLLTSTPGTYGMGTLIVPGHDTSYKVTVSHATIDGYDASTRPTPGILVQLPAPSTPNAAHSLTITYVISGSNRTVVHDIRSNWKTTGQVVEVSPTAGSSATLNYTWDTSIHGWYVSSYVGSTAIRQHGPDVAASSMPLYFSPEVRALGTFSAIEAAAVNAMSGVPLSLTSYMGAAGQCVDIVHLDLLESLGARDVLDPSWSSSASGRFYNPVAIAQKWTQATNGTLDGRTMLHEIGHTWDRYALGSVGATWGIDPYSGTPDAYDTLETFYEGGALQTRYIYTPTTVTYYVYDTDGVTELFSGITDRQQYALFSNEQTIRDLYDSVPDHSGNYYRSNTSEWAAQCFMLIWADHVSGYDVFGRDLLIADIGGPTVLADFKAHAVSIGVHPSTW